MSAAVSRMLHMSIWEAISRNGVLIERAVASATDTMPVA
jgi:hypothetical protein